MPHVPSRVRPTRAAALEQELADGASPPGPYVSMINQLRTALRLAGEGQVEQGERLVIRVGERIAGMVERGQMDPGLADTLLDIVDAIVAEEDVCAPTVLEGDAIVTDATLLGWSTLPVTHVTGSVIIDGLTSPPRCTRLDPRSRYPRHPTH
jgi:hypothetical protein